MAATADELVRLGGLQVRVRRRGQGPALLLLNGLGAPLELWDPLVRNLPGFEIISFDAPGSGASDTPQLPMSMGEHAELARQLLDAVGQRRTHVLGLSFGGMVAQELARLAPDRVERLVLASTTCGWGGVPGHPAAMVAIQTPDRYFSQSLFAAVAPHYIGGRESRDATFLATQGATRRRHPPSTLGYLYQLWAAAAWSSRQWLPQIGQPTLVLAGADDPLVPPGNARILAGLLPRAEAIVVPGGGHLCLLERAEDLAPRLATFLLGGVA